MAKVQRYLVSLCYFQVYLFDDFGENTLVCLLFLVFISAIRQERFGESAKRFKAGSRGRMDDLRSKRCGTRCVTCRLSGCVENSDGKLWT